MENNFILNIKKTAWPYSITTAAATTPVTLAEVKEHLKIDADDDTQDTYLTMLIEATTDQAEKYTGRDFINRSYTTYRDSFLDPLELRRAPISSVTSIEYLVSESFSTLASTVYDLQNNDNGYPYIYLKKDQQWPTNADSLPQAVKIIFVSGYGAAATDVPSGLKVGLLNHIAMLYENRGDCSNDCSGSALPANAKSFYNRYRIINIGSYERPSSYYRL